MKKILFLMLAFVLAFGVISCGSDDNPTDNPGEQKQEEQKEVYYKVNYENTTLAATSVLAGSSLAQPSDPTKANHIFMGWYSDAKFTNQATFPMTINADTNLYARFVSYEEAFVEARKNTIGDNANSYEFDYTLDCTVTYSSLNLTGNTVGNSKYNKNSEVSFYDEHVNSGILFYDGTKYQIRKGTTLQHISLNEDGELNKYTVEQVADDYKFDSSSFAKGLFKWDDEKVGAIEKTSNADEYKLDNGFSFSDGVAVVGNYINHPMVVNVLGTLPETSAETKILVTFKNGYINTYKYIMTINVATITLNLTYTATFKNVNKVSTIVPKTITGIGINENEITAAYNTAFNAVKTYKAQAKSSYDFKLETALGFEDKNDINATFKGATLRKLDGGTTYFHNDIEIDSDYKNADVYKAVGIDDIHVKKTKLSTGQVYLLEKGLLSWNNGTEITDYVANANDNYYLLNLLDSLNNFSFSQTIVDGSETEYVFGLTKENIQTIVEFINKMDLDPANKATYDVLLFGNYSDIVVNESEFTITLKNGVLESIEIDIEGTMNTSLASSRDFETKQAATFDIELEIEVTDDYKDYEPYETVKKAK